MSDKPLLNVVFHRLKQVKTEKSISHISEGTIDGEHPLTRYHNVTSRHAKLKKLPTHLWGDLFFISNDLVHFTCLLFVLRPFTNIPAKEKGTYHQNWYDARYLSYASVLHAAVYNFWDRIGDLLNCFFQIGLHQDAVYISRVLNNFFATARTSPAFEAIDNLYAKHVKSIIFERNADAHN